MPGPLIAAVAGGLGSAIIGSRASSSAAKSQSRSADHQLQLQADMFNRTDQVQQNMYGAQRDTINANTDKARNTAGNAYDVARQQANSLSKFGMGQATDTRNANAGLNKNAFRAGTNRTRDAMYDTYRENNATYSRGMGTAKNALDANLAAYQQEKTAGTKQIWRDRANNIATYGKEKDASLGYFEPSIGRGNDAGAAYAYNLGLGDKPKGYTGLQESEGTKYLMNTGRQEIEGGAAGAGGLYSGATLAALEKKRQGLASLDKDNQMGQMMALAGLGQNAANSAATVRAGYADDVAGQRTGATSAINALRAGYTGAMAGERGDYRDTAIGLDQTRNSGNTSARNLGTATMNSLQDVYANRGIGINNSYMTNTYGIQSDRANALTNASDTLAARNIDAANNNTANLGAARANRANLQGANAANYTAGASSAIANKGDAKAAGAIGGANALMGGLQNGLGLYGMMGGQFGQGAQTPTVPTSGTNVFANANPFANPFANIGSWFK